MSGRHNPVQHMQDAAYSGHAVMSAMMEQGAGESHMKLALLHLKVLTDNLKCYRTWPMHIDVFKPPLFFI